MKKITLLAYSLIVAVILSLPACKGSGDEPKDYNAMISKSPWKIISATLDGKDEFSDLNECYKDDLFRYQSGGSYSLEEGTTKCNTNDPQIFSEGTWSYDPDTKLLTMNQTSGSGQDGTFLVKELSSTKMVLEAPITFNGVKKTLVQQLVPVP
ncbi:lipocalin family protein [Cytophagaceae bacterium DM2B3-1]|uniref:Lipocalin family protein n=1 Tax=Xanthocytophaga flava TaxID=3048013 RepID=A0AAE3U8B2_9BACT|nr:lipocalin family protein [Xanthocytophaga flavus]MDJ1469837.1 lipocalin family protein [Xanthocytophaga flavus]MDJ1483241.1 lipocalin family protein [Xanthocytophaga flavus]MDJ1494350.1 lipocalin family protein [Xanthocytophaga flavus]